MMLSIIKAKIESFFARRSYQNRCYNDMEQRGSAYRGRCNGHCGGSSATGYLSETCIGCKYLKM